MAFIYFPDARFETKAEPRPVDAALRAIADRLLKEAVKSEAYGLAAVHIGEIAPIVVMSTAPTRTERAYLLLFNPLVTTTAQKTEAGQEGSVSMPGIEAEVLRPKWVEIAYDDAEGKAQSIRFEGYPARVALHEIDQMNGIFFLNRVSRLKRDMALRKWKKRPG